MCFALPSKIVWPFSLDLDSGPIARPSHSTEKGLAELLARLAVDSTLGCVETWFGHALRWWTDGRAAGKTWSASIPLFSRIASDRGMWWTSFPWIFFSFSLRESYFLLKNAVRFQHFTRFDLDWNWRAHWPGCVGQPNRRILAKK